MLEEQVEPDHLTSSHDATVDDDVAPGDVARVGRTEEGDCVPNVLGLPEALDARETKIVVLDLLLQVPGHVGLDEAGADDIDRDVALASFKGEGFGEADERRFRARVDRLVKIASLADDRADADDATVFVGLGLLLHWAVELLGQENRSHEVRLDDQVHVRWREPGEEVVLRRAGVVDQDVRSLRRSKHLLGNGHDLVLL